MMTDDEIIAVVQAHKEGKKIETRVIGFGDWNVKLLPYWDTLNQEYRVAPEPREPREWLAKVAPNGDLFSYDVAYKGWKVVRVREVIE